MLEECTNIEVSLRLRGDVMKFCKPWVMGIVNVTPDSFYSLSRTPDKESVVERVDTLVAQGVDCLDVGGYSSRPGASDVSECEEYRRLAVALEYIRETYPDVIISVDTFRASVARSVVKDFGVDIINDIGGGRLDSEMWNVVAETGAAYVLMHSRGTPETMQSLTDYKKDVAAEVLEDLVFKIDILRQMGVSDIIVDPGFGFAKTVGQNFRILDCLEAFKQCQCPVLAGLSRKTMIWKTLGITPEESCNGTTALNMVALMKGADILRVHDVRQAVETVRLYKALKNSDRSCLDSE